ncbi:hypothetical protein [Deinococcus peraridilitoris]|uniref:Uncharacterized protein n=1 Tax=Deinococcus peraridilitoris (strain DSM 19664 / LMG 22246 / CIP 109416 / KR-200) TaxID=937777 RepID=L0A155_DEIPD|nr:hypothetical protein [Deinococcus peraridilitoris]AFZ67571.1 hypothetical protein Deipe_2075 [Deinococcus peraridilitoris DSM 19664]
MTTIAQALRNAGLTKVYDVAPASVPKEAYAVVSDLTDTNTSRQYGGHAHRRTVNVALYGAPGSSKTTLNALYHTTRALSSPGTLTAHPGLERVRGVQLGACLPPDVPGDIQRPFAAVRLILSYLE